MYPGRFIRIVEGWQPRARKAGCDLRLINFNKQVRQLLGLTNLLAVFEACGEFRIRLP